MPNKNHIRVIKVPLPQPPKQKPPIYQRMPRMYLELIENKEKIQPQLLNKEFVGDITKLPQTFEQYQPTNFATQQTEQSRPNTQERFPTQYGNNTIKEHDRHHHEYRKHKEHTELPRDRHEHRHEHRHENRHENRHEHRKHKISDNTRSPNYSDKSAESYYSSSESDSDTDNYSSRSRHASSVSYDSSDTDDTQSVPSESNYTTESDKHHSVDVSNRLKELLDDDSVVSGKSSQSERSYSSNSSYEQYERSGNNLGRSASTNMSNELPYNASQHSSPSVGYQMNANTQQQMFPQSSYPSQPAHSSPPPIFGQQDMNGQQAPAPTLSELRGSYQVPNQMMDAGQIEAAQQDEEDKKREILFKFDLLKKSYKEAEVPDFSIHSDYNTMQKTYDNTLKSLSVDNTVESYKTYLIGGFMVVEYFLGSFFKFDMKGFTQHQIMNMNNYERLLIELGEKSYVPTDSDWPVEVRLLIMVLIQAAVFVLGKVIMNKTGSNVLSMFNSLGAMGGGTPQSQEPKRKMKGPDINFDDIPDS